MVAKEHSLLTEQKSGPESNPGAFKEVRFVVYGDPVPKDRPRAAGHIYTPRKTENAESTVCLVYKSIYRGFRFEKGVPLRMVIDFYYRVAKSDSKKKKEQKVLGEIRPTQRPDLDNVAKLVQDAVNGVAYYDDSQIVELTVRKFFSEQPRTEVYIVEVGADGE